MSVSHSLVMAQLKALLLCFSIIALSVSVNGGLSAKWDEHRLRPVSLPFSSNATCGARCDVSRKFIIILGSSWSGATVLHETINRLPGVELSGEHFGSLEAFKDLQTRLEFVSQNAASLAWQQNISDLLGTELSCLVQRWFFRHTGAHCSPKKMYGFKEIRYHYEDILNFIVSVFPSSKVVISYRNEFAQGTPPSRSMSDVEARQDVNQNLVDRTQHLMAWGKRHSKRCFFISNEELNVGAITRLVQWLGFPNCLATAAPAAAAPQYPSIDGLDTENRTSFHVDCPCGSLCRRMKMNRNSSIWNRGDASRDVRGVDNSVAGTHLQTACHRKSRCNLTAHEWIIILGTGRSGSTTLLEMVNLLPGVELNGENNGALFTFYNLKERLSWGPMNEDILKVRELEIHCLVQRWFLRAGETDCSSRTIVRGFKEIRYHDPAILEFISASFPSARFVVNYRQDYRAQLSSESAWFGQDHDAEKELLDKNANILAWARGQPRGRVFELPMENFNAANFTALYSWLGFSGCMAQSVLHLNNGARGGYTGNQELSKIRVQSGIIECH